MKKAIIILITIMLLGITGCSNNEDVKKDVIKHDYTYTGENSSWIAEYTVKGTTIFITKGNKIDYERDLDRRLTLTYKKDKSELDSVKYVKISRKSSVRNSSIEGSSFEVHEKSVDGKTFVIFEDQSASGMIEREDEIPEVTINIDGIIQKIKLENIDGQ